VLINKIKHCSKSFKPRVRDEQLNSPAEAKIDRMASPEETGKQIAT
jgi:hypothetical protein